MTEGHTLAARTLTAPQGKSQNGAGKDGGECQTTTRAAATTTSSSSSSPARQRQDLLAHQGELTEATLSARNLSIGRAVAQRAAPEDVDAGNAGGKSCQAGDGGYETGGACRDEWVAGKKGDGAGRGREDARQEGGESLC